MAFQIDQDLLKFESTVTPKVGAMTSYSNQVIKKNEKVAQTAGQCGDSLSGSYQTNNTDKAVQAYKKLQEGCTQIANDVSGKMLPILADCTALQEKITRLHEIQEEADRLQAAIDAKLRADPPQDVSAEQAQLEKLAKEFDALHEEAKAKLQALKGKDAPITDMEPTNGSLGVEPNITVDVQKAVGGKDKYYDYQLGDQSITSIGNDK